MSIKALVWDVDDTLFDYTGADRAGMRGHLAAEGLLDGYESVEQALSRWRDITDVQWARFAAGESDWQGQRRDRVREFLGEPLSDAEADGWFQPVRRPLRSRLGPLPGRAARPGRPRRQPPARSPVQLQPPQPGPQAPRPRRTRPLRDRPVRGRTRSLQARRSGLPCRLRIPGSASAPGRVRRRPSGDRRTRRRRGGTALHLDRPWRRSHRSRGRSQGPAPDCLAGRTPRDPRR